MNYLRYILLILSGFLFSLECNSQLTINEFLASNASINSDSDFHKNSDWVELYNSGANNINLKGYFITDNISNATKWQITIDTIIPSKAFVLIWADGENTGLHTSFKLSKDGEEIAVYSPAEILLDSVTFGVQAVDISQGRETDGATTWGFFQQPTPGASNTTTSYKGFVENVPDFSVLGGFFNSPKTIELSRVMDGTIRYTADGSEPTESSSEYKNPLIVAKTTVIRARIFKTDLIPGRIITNSYFINEDFTSQNLPVVSLATNPENFWDSEKGIYVQDFKPGWEIPVNIELFENNGSDRAAFNLQAGTKVNGLYSWQLPQKMLGVYFKKKYGEPTLNYSLFFDNTRINYNDFALRASGSDWSYTLFRDMLGQHATKLNMDLDIMDFRPCVVYVNGEYMGIHNIREKVDEDYITGNHGLDGGTFDLVENQNYPESGDLQAYNSFLAVLHHDLSVQSNFDAVANIMNIKDFTDLVITEMCVENTSVDHNVMAWKPKNSGKWKWVLMDLDRGFFNPDKNLINYYVQRSVWPFADLMENDKYVDYFGQRLADQLYTSFHPRQMIKLIDEHAKDIETEIPRHVSRWLGTTSKYGNAMPSADYWYQQVEALKTFVKTRPQILLGDLANYGFNPPVDLAISVYPPNAGFITLDSLRIPGTDWSGPYPQGLSVSLKAFNKPGFKFAGWYKPVQKTVIPKNSSWKYLDDGSDGGTAWYSVGFDDGGWKSGNAKLGYGDGDETTTLSYGGNSSNKYITYYFRKKFVLAREDLLSGNLTLNILRDDGAVVYVNGKEVLRTNMPTGAITYQTLAGSTIGGSAESTFYSYTIDTSFFQNGENLIAVEIHQAAIKSSDIGFNLELKAEGPDSTELFSVNPQIDVKVDSSISFMAKYSSSGACLLPDTITENTTLETGCSPFLAQGNVVVNKGVTLTIDPGVNILMPEKASLFVYGKLVVDGTDNNRVVFKLNPEYSGTSWGDISFIDSPDTSVLNYVTVEDASHGPGLYNAVAAISAYKSKLSMDHLYINKVAWNPVSARYSDIILTNSFLHSEITGDLINVKYGKARIENCEFAGNKMPDTDAVDYDNDSGSVIRKCLIYNMYGSNSDAIDIGEKAFNVQIDSNTIYNVNDKGVSVGQHSSATISNCTFVNCNLGLGLKDSCHVFVDHCTFYNVGIPVSCFEKNIGGTGGNAVVKNSILSNSVYSSFFSDNRSKLSVSYSLSDNDSLSEGNHNLFGNPQFVNPTLYNFNLENNSPAIGTGFYNDEISNIGNLYSATKGETEVQISAIFYNAGNDPEKSEFLMLHNPSDKPVDISYYQITNGIECTIPENTILNPQQDIYIVKNKMNPPASYYPGRTVQWAKGYLANEGESVLLQNNYGIVIDKVHYRPEAPWPVLSENNEVITLVSPDVDNHFGENWKSDDYYTVIYNRDNLPKEGFTIFPNPSPDMVYVESSSSPNARVYLYSLEGKLITSCRLNENGYGNINLSDFENGVYILKLGKNTIKVVVIH